MKRPLRPGHSLIPLSVLGLLLLPMGLSQAQAAAPDAERCAWAYRRSVEVGPPASAFASCDLPPEVTARAQADLRDLRLVDAAGAEVPYVADRVAVQAPAARATGRLVDVRREARLWSRIVVDLGRQVAFDRIDLVIQDQDFAKGLTIEASNDSQQWSLVRRDAGVFDRAWGARIHHTQVLIDEGASARWLRLTLDDRRSRPVDVVGVAVTERSQVATARWSWPVALTRLEGQPAVSRYRLDLPPGLLFDRVQLASADPAFARRVTVLDVRTQAGRADERPLGQGVLYRLRIAEPSLSAESLALDLAPGARGASVLEIQDGDSPPLRNLSVRVSGPSQRLLFPATGEPLVLYYGNPATRAPVYDLEGLRSRLVQSADVGVALLGPEAQNPYHRAPEPLSFVATTGGECEAAQWRFRRSLVIAGATDIYTLRLTAQDVGLLRPDLGDLRVVAEKDGEWPQVPYLLEDDSAEERVEMDVTRRAARLRADSRYALKLPPVFEGQPPVPLPLAGLELDVAEPFFQRSMRLLGPEADSGKRVFYEGSLQRTAHERNPLRLALGSRRLAEALLEVDEGDNAPLTLRKAWAVVRVPRIVFKAEPGQYALISGNPLAPPPRYDLALLRQHVLAYSALELKAGGLGPNPSFRRPTADYFRQAPPTTILWVVIVVAVVVLLALTVRILRRSASDDQDPQAG
jgi:hypothetical protein